MRKKLTYVFIFSIVFAFPGYGHASTKLYISDDCKNCKLIMQVGGRLISDLEKKEELEIINVTDLKIDLPALPALVDGKKVIIGTGLLRYLADKTGTQFSQQEYRLLNDCPKCPKTKNAFLLKMKEKIMGVKGVSLPVVVAGLGLVDGINPCAFTTAIFFISFLTFSGYRKKEIMLVSSMFILGVFFTYLLLGLGLLNFLKGLKYLSPISYAMTWFAVVLSVLFAALSLYDWYQYKHGQNPKKISLKLPDRIRQKIQLLITSNLRFKRANLLFISASLGISISFLESLCTGQMYVPTLTLISNNTKNQLFSLIIYNLMFIIPLLLISSLGFLGINSEHISKIFRRNLGKIKLLTASIFCGLSIFLIAGLK